jgi:hypothetical protein
MTEYNKERNRRFKTILVFVSAMMMIGFAIVFVRAVQPFVSNSEWTLNLLLGIICVLYLVFICLFLSGHIRIDSMSQIINIQIYDEILVLPSSRAKTVFFFEAACIPLSVIDKVYRTINGYLIEFQDNRYEPYYLNSRLIFEPDSFKKVLTETGKWSNEPRSIEKLKSYDKQPIIDASETIFLSGKELKSLSGDR